MPHTTDLMRTLMRDFGQFITAVDLNDDDQSRADELISRALTLSFPEGGVDIRWGDPDVTTDGYRSHSVALAQVDAILRGQDVDGAPYPDGADLGTVVDHASNIMDGFDAVASVAKLHASSTVGA